MGRMFGLERIVLCLRSSIMVVVKLEPHTCVEATQWEQLHLTFIHEACLRIYLC